MHGLEVGAVHVSVNLGGRNVGMTKHFLDDAQIGAAAEQMGGEAVAQEMGIDVALQAGAGGVLLDQLPDALGRQFLAAHGEKNFGAGAGGRPAWDVRFRDTA